MTACEDVDRSPGALQRKAWADGVLPPVERVAPGLWSIPVPIPDNPLRYVLVYAFELADGGLALVDAGWDTDDAWAALRDGLTAAGGSIADVRAVLVTHIHPDHYGLAGRVREASGAWVGLHPADAALVARDGQDVAPLVDRTRALLGDCGVPHGEIAAFVESSASVSMWMQTTAPDRHIEDHQRLDLAGWDLHALWTPGHSPGHLCFADPGRGILLTGDCVLPRISPNVAVHAQQRPNPLAEFLDSLAHLRRHEPDLVLPAHEYRFTDLAGRIDSLARHHEHRLDAFEAAVVAEPGVTCWQLTERATWSRPWARISGFMRRAANGETLAHLELLAVQGRIVRRPGPPTTWFPGPRATPDRRAGDDTDTAAPAPGCC